MSRFLVHLSAYQGSDAAFAVYPRSCPPYPIPRGRAGRGQEARQGEAEYASVDAAPARRIHSRLPRTAFVRRRPGRLGAALFFQRGAAALEVVDGACGVSGKGNGRPSVSDFKGEALPRRQAAQEVVYEDVGQSPRHLFFLIPKPRFFHSRALIEAIANVDELPTM